MQEWVEGPWCCTARARTSARSLRSDHRDHRALDLREHAVDHVHDGDALGGVGFELPHRDGDEGSFTREPRAAAGRVTVNAVLQRTATPLRGRYLVQNRLWRAWFAANDLALRFTSGPASARASTQVPRRILVAVGGHLGDAVIATRAVAQIARELPGASIGILSGSWNRAVFDGHPSVQWFHAIDHWKVNRAAHSALARLARFRQSRRNAIREIREVGYDSAIDLYAYYPNSADVLAAAGIPNRVGFVSGGYGRLYTQRLNWQAGWRVSDDHRTAIQTMLPGFQWDETANYSLPAIPAAELERWAQRRASFGLREKSYVILHPGAGAAFKRWPIERWAEVGRQLSRQGARVVITGAGAAESALAAVIARDVPEAVNLSGQLSWIELRCAIGEASLVICLDSVAAHLAAAAETPCAALATGVDDASRWLPSGVRHLTNAVPCSPCFRSNGCEHMACVRELSAGRVMSAAEAALRARSQ